MRVERLRLNDIRIITMAELELDRHINVFSGRNGAGKTSVLEAAHVLSDGRTFRHALVRPLIRDGQAQARVVGELVDGGGRLHRAGVEKSMDGSTRCRLDRRDVSAVELAAALPVLLLSRDHGDVVSEGPGVRRRLLDWILFHVEPGFYDCWRRFRRALQQRNQLLRRGRMAAAQLDAWDQEFLVAAAELHRMRSEHVQGLAALFAEPESLLLEGAGAVALGYAAGWDSRRELGELLSASRERDLHGGHTASGPHRADLLLRCEAGSPDKVLSTGQRKMLGWSLRLAAARYVEARSGTRPVLLVDEMGADLDAGNLQRLAAAIAAPGLQILSASVQESAERTVWSDTGSGRLFHVEHGRIEDAGML